MEALTRDDLLPLTDFAARRREYFAAHMRYLDRHRRVRLGPRLMLVFENRQTLWFRVQEILRVARLAEGPRVQQVLDLYNRLLPARDRLQAAMLLSIDETRLEEELQPWQGLCGDQLSLQLGPIRCPANLLTCRPEDRAIGTAHWVQFVVDARAKEMLGDGRVPATLEVNVPGYQYSSGPLSEDVRQSLLEDLWRG